MHGYLLLDCAADELVAGVRALARGARYLCQAAMQCVADSLTRHALTERETDVLQLLALGLCNKRIGRELGIAVGTVKAHVKAILHKLDAGTRTQAVVVATERGLIARATPPHGAARSAPARPMPPALVDARRQVTTWHPETNKPARGGLGVVLAGTESVVAGACNASRRRILVT